MSSRAEKLSFILAIRKNVSVERAFDVFIKERKERKVCHGIYAYSTSVTGLFWRKVAGYTGSLSISQWDSETPFPWLHLLLFVTVKDNNKEDKTTESHLVCMPFTVPSREHNQRLLQGRSFIHTIELVSQR